MAKRETVKISEKLALTIEEAAEYSNIGTKRLRELCKEPHCRFILKVNSKTLIKRREFEQFISGQTVL